MKSTAGYSQRVSVVIASLSNAMADNNRADGFAFKIGYLVMAFRIKKYI